jgi:hypothetical protein
VAVPTKKRDAFVESSGALEGWSLVSLASGREAGIEVWFLVGGPEVEGLIERCFMVALVGLILWKQYRRGKYLKSSCG